MKNQISNLCFATVIVLLLTFSTILACSAPTPAPSPVPPTPPPTAEEASEPEPQPQLIPKEIELKYDDGQARDPISTVSPNFGGHIVEFTPPDIPFTINEVKVAGTLSKYAKNLEGKEFDVQILNNDLEVIYSVTYPYTKFSAGSVTWVVLDIPDVEVSDTFYVHIYTDSPHPGLHIGADDSVLNDHSDVTVRTPEGVIQLLAKWPYGTDFWFGDKNKVNWMIRVNGTFMVPE